MSLCRRNVLFSIVSLPASTLLAGRALPGLTATVYNGYELHTALLAAGHGSAITLAPGDYGDIGSFTLAGSGVSLRVPSPRRTVLRAPLLVSGDSADLEGLAFEEGVHLAGAGQRIASSSFVGRGVVLTGPGAEVLGCTFAQYRGKAVDVRATATGASIHGNTFRDGASGNAIMVGVGTTDTNKRVGARILGNTFQDCSRASAETVTFKSSGNTLSGNRFINCNNIAQRHGDGNTISSNTLQGSQGIVVQDSRTLVAGNVLASGRGPGIQVMAGTSPWNAQHQGDHPQAAYTVLRGNRGPLYIGRRFAGYDYPAINTRVESHTGPIRLGFETGTVGVPGAARGSVPA